ncbi:MAG: C39 family peptidase [Deltaproteobacteria bacterium]|nr:C39 family peptidase [Deltaproteobacteria bacterium]
MPNTVFERYKGMVFAIPFFILLYGCAPHADIVKEGIYKNPQAGFYIKNVPFFSQERYYCGPASLSSVINFYGVAASEEEITKEVYNPKLNGAISIDILKYARAKGFDASYYKGSLPEIKKEISAERPVILFVDFGYGFYPVRHYMVAIGYNDEIGYLIAHSGTEKDKTFSYSEIQNAWEKTGFGTILIVPKGK